MFRLLHVALLHQRGLELLHHVPVPPGHLLVVDDRGGVVHSYHTFSIFLDLYWSFPWLINIFCGDLCKLR